MNLFVQILDVIKSFFLKEDGRPSKTMLVNLLFSLLAIADLLIKQSVIPDEYLKIALFIIAFGNMILRQYTNQPTQSAGASL